MYCITLDGVYGHIRAIVSFLISHPEIHSVFDVFWYMLYYMQIDVLKQLNLLQLF